MSQIKFFPLFYSSGFSVGDDLGLTESISNLEGSKRRALNLRTNVNNIGVLPASKMPVNITITSLDIRCSNLFCIETHHRTYHTITNIIIIHDEIKWTIYV